MSEKINRRQALGRLGKVCVLSAAAAGLYGGLYGRPLQAAAPKPGVWKSHFPIAGAPEATVLAAGRDGVSPAELLKSAFDALGGLSKFISRGDVVALKPNMSWNRAPELAANTNPEVVIALTEMCLNAGAAKVHLVDNSIAAARQAFVTNGMAGAAQKTGAKLFYPASSLYKDLDLGGRRLGEWSVYTPVIEADKLINLPVAKHHGLTRLTLGMKNWIGAVGGRRGALHQDIHQSIVDLANFFRPTLVVLDATRVLLRNGPSGGRPSDAARRDTIIVGTDQVAVDALATSLFDMFPDEIGHILLADQQGLGRADPGPDRIIEVAV